MSLLGVEVVGFIVDLTVGNVGTRSFVLTALFFLLRLRKENFSYYVMTENGE